MKQLTIYLFILFLGSVVSGCRKLVEVGAPITNSTSESVYNSDAKAAAVITSIYDHMSGDAGSFAQGQNSISLYAGLSADELETYTYVGGIFLDAYTNSSSFQPTSIWLNLYKYIYVANAAIEGINDRIMSKCQWHGCRFNQSDLSVFFSYTSAPA